ncbi:hypothetical protein A3D77_03430 [Candidatus Gottesmanbacteria bacterium RIFCSPHIGHO2_02_FULL_39_11]|uniref:Asl1-like glycosyl hydrolase catalytic domain-containing protein n=1 Tax=Candidatus Gottesmanbacteria bacterium RIFCSPHIGHO2_02_FULL_39_11 TaxID=1798382 RepID=A0A1F5ZNF9_9BACT|nr:MAG: hypothetical protein A3D77_03430 [Candidatus Gottesmanbacteria bacterium RIFCSPHIGHO2_02_FULL_39_11]
MITRTTTYFIFSVLYILLISFFLFFSFSLFHPSVLALEDPRRISNNKYGIDIVDENDLFDASYLVNSSGGDWGYATLVIPENERKTDKWNAIFERMGQLHLIPIIRLATHVEGNRWTAPKKEDAPIWADFLNNLNWPTKNRYVVLFNEPNHANEWGGYISPEEYAEISSNLSRELKNRSGDFYIMLAGFDAAAPTGRDTLDEEIYIRRMIQKEPAIFDSIDGWASHSYPNPGFSGEVGDSGRKSLQGYKWELFLLKNLGIDKDFPIFITETGWAHDQYDPGVKLFSPDDIASMITDAANNVWSDSNVVAVTPFILNYQSTPFSQFSWRKQDSAFFYPFFDAYRSIPKIAGNPTLNEKIQIAVIPVVKAAETTHIPSTPTPHIDSENTKTSSGSIFDKLLTFFKNLSSRFG